MEKCGAVDNKDNAAGGADNNLRERSLAFERLYEIICRLRAPDGCPWDREQTPETLRETVIEESYETVEAITEGNTEHVKEELGDVLLNAMMISYIYQQSGDFSVADTFNAVSDKLIRRHPHVFGRLENFAGPDDRKKASTVDAVLSQWDEIKTKVEGRSRESVLDGISEALPPLMRAFKIQKKAAKVGFDFPSVEEIWKKVEEEKEELKAEIAKSGMPPDIRSSSGSVESYGMEDEIGDFLFSVVNLARRLGINPAVALTRANSKFVRRFRYVEEEMKGKKLPLCKENLAEMDSLWNTAKKKGL